MKKNDEILCKINSFSNQKFAIYESRKTLKRSADGHVKGPTLLLTPFTY